MKTTRKAKGNQKGAWHAVPQDWSIGDRTACKRWRFSAYRTTETGDLRNVKRGDRVCLTCIALVPEFADRYRIVHRTIPRGVRP